MLKCKSFFSLIYFTKFFMKRITQAKYYQFIRLVTSQAIAFKNTSKQKIRKCKVFFKYQIKFRKIMFAMDLSMLLLSIEILVSEHALAYQLTEQYFISFHFISNEIFQTQFTIILRVNLCFQFEMEGLFDEVAVT